MSKPRISIEKCNRDSEVTLASLASLVLLGVFCIIGAAIGWCF